MKLSIITINLNNAIGLQKTIESVVSQTFTNFEYIVIDGGSTDKSVDIIRQYANKIVYWVSEPDKGIYNAMNKGILKASGEYCLFLNSGDWLYNEKILDQVFCINFHEDIVYCDLKTVNNDEIVGEFTYPDKLTFDYFFLGSIGHPGAFIKRQLFDSYLYNEQNEIVSDWEFFMIMFGKCNATYKHLPFFLSCFDLTGISSQEKNWKKAEEERISILKKEFSFFYDDYVLLQDKISYYNRIRNRSLKGRVRDLVLFIIKAPNFNR
jgi:glycosyltransferase involved in cell wall biosynthesis